MASIKSLTYTPSKTPKAAAIAGILFALLLIAVFGLLRLSVPADPREPGSWLRENSDAVYLGMLFSAAALIGGLIIASAAQPKELIDSATFHFAPAAAYNIVNIYLTKMASVFMMTTSTVAIYTGLTPRWLAFVGYGMSLLLLFGSYSISWGFIVFPLWVLLTSIHVLFDNIRGRSI
jgi:hypothetical protein